MAKRVAGLFVFLLGLVLLCWVGYNLLVRVQPTARGVKPLPAIFFFVRVSLCRPEVDSKQLKVSARARSAAGPWA